jgi:hypothetical protein
MQEYFSDRELGPVARTEQDIGPRVWRGLAGFVESLITSGGLGIDFPGYYCQDGDWITGTDRQAFSLALQLEIPGIDYPLKTTKSVDQPQEAEIAPEVLPDEPYAPPTATILDVVQFCYRHVAEPIQLGIHPYFGHSHLSFDRPMGQASYLTRVNHIFARNGIAFELLPSGAVERLAPPVLRERLRSAIFRTGDRTLDDLLENARGKFLSHDPKTRRESLETLWDAWERLKTIDDPRKPVGINMRINSAANEPAIIAFLDAEGKVLTKTGNEFDIRHKEVDKVPVREDRHVDYLFHRLFALIWLLLTDK